MGQKKKKKKKKRKQTSYNTYIYVSDTSNFDNG